MTAVDLTAFLPIDVVLDSGDGAAMEHPTPLPPLPAAWSAMTPQALEQYAAVNQDIRDHWTRVHQMIETVCWASLATPYGVRVTFTGDTVIARIDRDIEPLTVTHQWTGE